MKTNSILALLTFSIALVSAVAPAMAGYECVAQNVRGDWATPFDRVTAKAMDDGKTYFERVINLGPMDPNLYSRRFFVINYSSVMDQPAIASHLSLDFPVYVSPPIRPLFAFLILDSGEYVARLVMDADGRDQVWRSKIVSKVSGPPYYLTVSFSVFAEQSAFLDALGKAASMAIELKYLDGETLTRQTFSVSRDYIRDTQILAQAMYRNNREKCTLVPPLSDVEL